MDYDPQALAVGKEIAGFRIVRLLGAGGFGITYEAISEGTGRHYAIKEFFPLGRASREEATRVVYASRDGELVSWALDRFERSTKELCQLRHPNIVEVFHYVKENNTGYMIMEYVEGTTLEGWLRERPSPPSPVELRPLLEPILSALDYVHASGRIHRDIAPDNIMIHPDGRPVLIDFGAIKTIEQRTNLARTYQVAKANYSPPEQSEATDLDPTADVYSFGAVLYRAFAGAPPADAEKRTRDLALSGADSYIPLSQATRNSLPGGIASTIDRALALRPKDRPQSVGELRAPLGWGAEHPSSSTLVEAEQNTRPLDPAAPARGEAIASAPAMSEAHRPARPAAVIAAVIALGAVALVTVVDPFKWFGSSVVDRQAEEKRAFEAAGYDPSKLQDYLNRCTICAFRQDARNRIERVEAERKEFEAAGDDPGRLQQYVERCVVCLMKPEAERKLAAIRTAESGRRKTEDRDLQIVDRRFPDKTLHATVGRAEIWSTKDRCFVAYPLDLPGARAIFYVTDYVAGGGRRVAGEVSLAVEQVTISDASIVSGDRTFSMSTQGNGGWMRNMGDESELVVRIKNGIRMEIIMTTASASQIRGEIDGTAVQKALGYRDRFCKI